MDRTIPRVLMWQLLVGIGLAAVLWVLFGKIVGYSAVFGSLICIIPNAFLALRLVASRSDSGAKALIRAAWIGEIGKLALTALLFTLVFTLIKPLAVFALFAGFIVTQLVIFSGLLMRHEHDMDNSNGN
ncbi:MAG: ATP synthase subunit I [Woeseiaceae bacterium]|nr:ATP synthase subunit I [Woeseiaceae bacterium]